MTTVLEVARVFKEMNILPKRSIIFLSFGSEEHGLMGSEEFVEEFNSILKERATIYINADVSKGYNMNG
jgi:Zn-dependent M28 family amino/carboxypeptidase